MPSLYLTVLSFHWQSCPIMAKAIGVVSNFPSVNVSFSSFNRSHLRLSSFLFGVGSCKFNERKRDFTVGPSTVVAALPTVCEKSASQITSFNEVSFDFSFRVWRRFCDWLQFVKGGFFWCFGSWLSLWSVVWIYRKKRLKRRWNFCWMKPMRL